MTTNMSFKDVAILAARTSGTILKERFLQPMQHNYKSRKDLVTQTDIDSELNIVDIITVNFPDHRITGEELGIKPSESPYKWIIDPLDGTTNYIAGIPFFSVSIGLCFENKPILAVTHDPLRDELFYAEYSKGAYLNGTRIKVAKKSSLDDCVVSYSRSYHPDEVIIQSGLSLFAKLLPRIRALRQLGECSLDFCYIACGRLDATITPLTDPKYEHPAGCLIVDEAEGKSTDFAGKNWDLNSSNLISANSIIHSSLLELIQGDA